MILIYQWVWIYVDIIKLSSIQVAISLAIYWSVCSSRMIVKDGGNEWNGRYVILARCEFDFIRAFSHGKLEVHFPKIFFFKQFPCKEQSFQSMHWIARSFAIVSQTNFLLLYKNKFQFQHYQQTVFGLLKIKKLIRVFQVLLEGNTS